MSVLSVTGRIGSDAELRETQGGTKVVAFSIADDVGFGEKKSTQWLKCAWFGDRAAKLHPYLTKGSLVEVHGSPQVEAWNDKKSSEARAQIKLTVSEVRLHGGGKSEQAAPKRGQQNDDEIPW